VDVELEVAPDPLDLVGVAADQLRQQVVDEQRHDRAAAGADGVAVADPFRPVGVDDAHERRLLAGEGLDRVGALHLGLEIDHHEVDADDPAHAIPLFEQMRRTYFTPPNVSPAMRCFWTMKVSISAGNDDEHRHGAHACPVDGELRGEVHEPHRHGLARRGAGELARQRIFVPRGEEGKDPRRGEAGAGERELHRSRTPASGCSRRSAPPRESSTGICRKKPSVSQMVNGMLTAR
jgi:hypothetical protein